MSDKWCGCAKAKNKKIENEMEFKGFNYPLDTPEKVAGIEYLNQFKNCGIFGSVPMVNAFIAGIRWQEERSRSESQNAHSAEKN